MMVTYQGSVTRLLVWQSANVRVYALAGLVAVVVYELLQRTIGWSLAVPSLPLAVVGGALGIFVSFRTNSAYARWWEGRQLWGRLVNSSRHWATQVAAYIPDPELRRELIDRQIGYVHVLRCVLRQQPPLADASVVRALSAADQEALAGQSNLCHALLQRQLDAVTRLADAGGLDARRLQSFDETVRQLLDIQGGCERIKRTPLPLGYGFIAETLVRYFSYLLPFAIVADLHILAIPINVLVCTAFILINEAGRVLEDPFTMFYNGLPLTNLSDTIEQNLRNRLGERDLDPLAGPDPHGILM